VLDPPYAQAADLVAALGRLAAPDAGWLGEAAVVVAKHFWKDEPPASVGTLGRVRVRRFGETALSVYRPEADHAEGAP
jgi:16S rRNA G966 N2-methylase RsmD